MSGDELVLPLRLHERNWWLLLDAFVPGLGPLTLVLDSGCGLSAMKEAVLADLVTLQRASRISAARYRVQQLSVAGVVIPDIVVRAGGPTERVDVDGIMGLDYLYQFQRVCVDTRTLQLTLTLP